MNCKSCKAELETDAVFCSKCGSRVDVEPAPEEVIAEEIVTEPVSETESATEEDTCFCPECGMRNDSSAAFCEACGFKIGDIQSAQEEPEVTEADPTFCGNCGAKVESDFAFCDSCGQKVAVVQKENSEPEQKKKTTQKEKSKLLVILGGVAAAAVIAVVGFWAVPKVTGASSSASGKSQIPTELMYIKDTGIYGIGLKNSKQKPVEYTDDFAKSDSIEYVTDAFSKEYQLVSEDGKYHFIIEDADYSDNTYTLYYKTNKGEPTKIDSRIQRAYRVTGDNKVIYRKNGNLYVNDLKNKEKIASDVVGFAFDKEEKNILWRVDSGNSDGTVDIYYQDLNLKKEKIKIDSECNILKTSSDLNTILIKKDDSIYLIKKQVEKEKLVGEAADVLSIDLNQGTFFYTIEVEDTVKAIDYVFDDMAAADALIAEPLRSDYEREETGGSGVFSYKKTVVDDKYYEDLRTYEEKVNRDELRRTLEEIEIEVQYTELYYYANGEKTLVANDFLETLSAGIVNEKDKEKNKAYSSYMLYTKVDNAETEKVNLSDLRYAEEIRYSIDSLRYNSGKKYLYANGTEVELDLEDKRISGFNRDVKNNQIYFLIKDIDSSNSDNGDLFSVSLSTSGLGTMEERDSDVSSLEIVSGDDVYYLRDVNDNGVGDLYCNGSLVLADVSRNSSRSIPDSDAILCLADPNKSKERATLVRVKNKKAEKLSEDVNLFHAFGENEIAMLTEYNYNKYKGELYYYNGKETYLLDSDVRGFFTTY